MAELYSSRPLADHCYVTNEASWTPATVAVWVRHFLLNCKIRSETGVSVGEGGGHEFLYFTFKPISVFFMFEFKISFEQVVFR